MRIDVRGRTDVGVAGEHLMGHVDGGDSYAGPEHRACNRATAGRGTEPETFEDDPERGFFRAALRVWGAAPSLVAPLIRLEGNSMNGGCPALERSTLDTAELRLGQVSHLLFSAVFFRGPSGCAEPPIHHLAPSTTLVERLGAGEATR